MTQKSELLTPADVVAYVREEYHYTISAETIRRWVRSGRLPAARSATGGILIDRRDVDALHRGVGPAA